MIACVQLSPQVANAVGAALSKVSGTEDVVRSLESASREDVLEQVKQSARQRAINAGAQPDTTEVVNIPPPKCQL